MTTSPHGAVRPATPLSGLNALLAQPRPEGARLLADVGGTNARFAWQAGPGQPIAQVQVLPCAQFETLALAMQTYLHGLGQGMPRQAAIAIANPITGDRVSMTNHHWSFSQADLKQSFAFDTLRLLNDFTALALALPDLPAADLRQVGGGVAVAGAACGLVGAGTGLGVSGLLPDGRGGWVPLQGEGGHVTLPAETERERTVMLGLQRLHGRASAERALCGQGLLDTYRLLRQADGMALADEQANGLALAGDPAAASPADRPVDSPAPIAHSPADVTRLGLSGADPHAVEALHLFCAMLGSVAGDLALTLGAHGGIYIGGGVVPRLGAWFDASAFRARFEAKGRFRPLLQAIPVWVITADTSPALLGAARALDALSPAGA